MGRQTHRLAGNTLVNTIHLVENQDQVSRQRPKILDPPSLSPYASPLVFGDWFVREDAESRLSHHDGRGGSSLYDQPQFGGW